MLTKLSATLAETEGRQATTELPRARDRRRNRRHILRITHVERVQSQACQLHFTLWLHPGPPPVPVAAVSLPACKRRLLEARCLRVLLGRRGFLLTVIGLHRPVERLHFLISGAVVGVLPVHQGLVVGKEVLVEPVLLLHLVALPPHADVLLLLLAHQLPEHVRRVVHGLRERGPRVLLRVRQDHAPVVRELHLHGELVWGQRLGPGEAL
mmetsp:Transcript_93909/g.303358  ORF Transcript_93909/g.303358 Transcript_93909/m.303358 type:complete len:210 (-) Transcript_93909:571-1200(-)